MSQRVYKEFQLSTEHKCLNETVLSERMRDWRAFWAKATKRSLVIQCLMTGAVTLRDCALIVVGETLVWADVKTGTLYDAKTGRSYTGNRIAKEPDETKRTLYGRPKITDRALRYGPKIPKSAIVKKELEVET